MFLPGGGREDMATLRALLVESKREGAPAADRVLAVFTEFPSNPLLHCCDLTGYLASVHTLSCTHAITH